MSDNYDYNSDEVDGIFDKIYAALDKFGLDPVGRLRLIRDALPKGMVVGEDGDELTATVSIHDNRITSGGGIWVEVEINGWTEVMEADADDVREAL